MKHINLFLVSLLFIFSLQASTPELPMVIGICSYNNSAWCKKNLDSVFSQKYQNYRVVYVDDCSPDGTADIVEAYVKECGQEHRFTLIKNSDRHLATANHYQINHSCYDNEIIVSLDGDDWFAHNNVLKKINALYAKKNLWIAYSQFRRWPSGKRGYSRSIPSEIVKDKAYRKHEWVCGQTRSYYAWLAKSVKLKDLLMHKDGHKFQGKFFPSSCDVALMLPMLEMADGRHHFITESLYVYNVHDFSDYRTNGSLQGYCSYCIRILPRYKPLETPRLSQSDISDKIDVIVLGSNVNNENFKKLAADAAVNKLYALTDETLSQFKNILQDNSLASFVMLITNTPEKELPLELSSVPALLRETRAYAWYPEPPHNVDSDEYEYFTLGGANFYFWQFWNAHPHNAGVIVMRKSKMLKALGKLSVTSVQDFLNEWRNLAYDPRDIGLFERNWVSLPDLFL